MAIRVVTASDLQALLDSVDARDSLAFVESPKRANRKVSEKRKRINRQESDAEPQGAASVGRAAILAALALEPCHTTGTHDPRHTLLYVCDLQRRAALRNLLALLNVREEDLPRRLHADCWSCREVPKQEGYREDQRRLHAWASEPLTAELAARGKP